MFPPSLPCIGNFVINISGEEFILPMHLSYIYVRIDMFVNPLMMSILLYLCMLYNLTIGYTSYWYCVIYLPGAYISPPLRHCYICIYINMFVNVISMVTAICLCTS